MNKLNKAKRKKMTKKTYLEIIIRFIKMDNKQQHTPIIRKRYNSHELANERTLCDIDCVG